MGNDIATQPDLSEDFIERIFIGDDGYSYFYRFDINCDYKDIPKVGTKYKSGYVTSTDFNNGICSISVVELRKP